MPPKKKLDRHEQDKLFRKLFPEMTYTDWQDFQLLVYNIIRRWKVLDES